MKPPRPYTVQTVFNDPPPGVDRSLYVAGYTVGSDATGQVATFGPFDASEAKALAAGLNNAYARGWGDATAGQLFREGVSA